MCFFYGIVENFIFNDFIYFKDWCYLDRKGNMRCEDVFKEIILKGIKVLFIGIIVICEVMFFYGN